MIRSVVSIRLARSKWSIVNALHRLRFRDVREWISTITLSPLRLHYDKEKAMSRYIQELCDALTRVFDHCAQLDRRRLAGYTANIDFWISEVKHRIAVIDGYIARRKTMIAGTKAVYYDDIQRMGGNRPADIESLVTPNVTDTSANWSRLEAEALRLRQQVLASTKRFVTKCLETELIDQDQLFRIEDELGVNLRG